MNDIIFEILKALVIVAVLLVTRYVIPWLKQQTEAIRNDELYGMVMAAVQYAEQTVRGEKTGEEKLGIVTDYLREMLIKKNISMTDEQLRILIESAVYAMSKEA